MRRGSVGPLIAVALGLLLVGGLAAGVTSAIGHASAANETATPEPTDSSRSSSSDAPDSSEWTLEELKEGGPRIANSPPSVRMGDTEKRSFWLVYWDANDPFASVGDPSSGEYQPEDHTLGRDEVNIRTWTYRDREETVHLVFWTKGTREVERGNATVVEPYAKNVRHVESSVTFPRGRPTVSIDLPNHQTETRVTMWIEGSSWARWTFKHKSLATTQSTNIDSEGDYLAAAITDFLAWIVVGGFLVGYLCKRALDSARIGPQYGYAPWIIGLSLVTGLFCLIFFENVAALVVNAQYVLSLFVVAIIGIVMLETYTAGVNETLLLQPQLEHTQSPKGDHAFDMIRMRGKEIKTVRTTSGTVSAVSTGLLAFGARAWGHAARIHNVERLETRADMERSKWDELFIVDPEAEELISYDREGWEISVPPMTRENAPEYLSIALGLSVAGLSIHYGVAQPIVVGGLCVVGLLAWAATPVQGSAHVEPAPVHIRSAFATMLNFAEDVDDAKRFDELKEQIDKERINKQRDVDKEVSNHDRTLVEEMLDPAENVPAAIEREDYSDSEIVDERREEPTTVADGGDDNEE